MDDPLRVYWTRKTITNLWVSIPILMDDPLRVYSFQEVFITGINKVSIPILMDDPLRVCGHPGYLQRGNVSIPILMDDPLRVDCL